MKKLSVVIIAVAAIAACKGKTDKPGTGKPPGKEPPAQLAEFKPAELPADVGPLYQEVTAFAPVTPRAGTGKVSLDLAGLVKDTKVAQVAIVPYDDEQWYEPRLVKLNGTKLETELDAGKSFVVALDLGDIALNNYHGVAQLQTLKKAFGAAVPDRICQVILCAQDTFRMDELPTRMPDLEGLGGELGGLPPDVSIGAIGRPSNVCDACFGKATPSIVPCFFKRCDVDWPVKRLVRVRKNVYTLTDAELASIRKGVEVMKARAPTDPTSWVYQAKMHALNSGSAAANQDQCQHRQFYFFPWHRMYTYYFEKILRKASGDPTLNLPYWNYTDDPAQAAIPPAWRDPADATNPLYDGTRDPIYNGGAGLPAADVSYASAFASTSFTTTSGSSFGGRTVTAPAHFPALPSGLIEQSPHNNVHNDIDGDMATGESPLDPVFWLHHGNIDRLWNKWIQLGGGRANPTGDTAWMNQPFTFFDENGAAVTIKGADVLNTSKQLGYRYDDDPVITSSLWKRQIRVAQLVELEIAKLPSPGPVKLTARAQKLTMPIGADGKRMVAGLAKDQRVTLRISDIRFDAPVGLTYLVFLNLPDADRAKADSTHPSYVGTLGFFGAHPAAGGHVHEGGTEEYDVTRVVKRLGGLDKLDVTILPSLPRIPAGRADLAALVARKKPKGNPRFGAVTLLRTAAP